MFPFLPVLFLAQVNPVARQVYKLAPTSLSGQPLLDDLSHRAVNYFWNESPAPYYLTRDRANNTTGTTDPNAGIASIAATGYQFSALAVGAKRGWLNQSAALTRARTVASNVLLHVPHYKGWMYHFLNLSDGSRAWDSEASTIDTSLFLNGLMMAEGYFQDATLTSTANQIYARVNWTDMRTNGGALPYSHTICHGYTPEKGYIPFRWDTFCELMHLYIAGFALAPTSLYGTWEYWNRGVQSYGGYKFCVGGPLFMHQMAAGFYDFRWVRDRLGYDYWVEGRNATLAQRAYCVANPGGFAGYGANIWGLSACDIPTGYGAQGAPGWTNDNGTLAPAAAVASVIYTPTESMASADAFVAQYPSSYGLYGFVSGLNPTQNWKSADALGIDLGQLMLNIENARDGAPWKWMMSQPRVQLAMQRAGFRSSREGTLTTRVLRLAGK